MNQVYKILKNGPLPRNIRLSLFVRKLFGRKPIELSHEVGTFKGVRFVTTHMSNETEKEEQ